MEKLLERLFVIPGVKRPFGLDVILDIVPVAGDIPAPLPPTEAQSARLTEFNRLSERMPPEARPAASAEVAANELFDGSQLPAGGSMQPVNCDVPALGGTLPKAGNDDPKRPCTVAELVRGNCR